MARKVLTVRLSRHAIQRWCSRVGIRTSRAALQDRVRCRLMAALKVGAQLNGAGALEVEVLPGVRAVCVPSYLGGWTVVTIV